jgi:hypothetical protein
MNSGYQINAFTQEQEANAAIKLANELGYTIGDARPTSSFVRTAKLINANANQYIFPITGVDPGNADFVTNQIVDQQNIFVVFAIGMFITVGAATASNFLPYTYVNTTIITTSGAPAALLNLWNGTLQVTVNKIQLVPAWNVSRHYYAPETQQQSLVTYAGATPIPLVDSINGATTGYYPVQKGFVLNGAAKTNWQLTLPNAIGIIQANSRIEFVMLGQLLVNVTTVK